MAIKENTDISQMRIVIEPGRIATSIDDIFDIQEQILEKYTQLEKSKDFDKTAHYYLTVLETHSFHNVSILMEHMESSKKNYYGMCFSPVNHNRTDALSIV